MEVNNIGYKAEVFISNDKLNLRWVNEEHIKKDRWSLRYCFLMAMEIAKKNLEERSYKMYPFYWSNGNSKWTIDEANAIISHIGIVNFLDSLNLEKPYAQAYNLLQAYRHYIHNRETDYIIGHDTIPDFIIEWVINNIPNFKWTCEHHYLDVDDGDMVRYHHYVVKDGVLTESWSE